MPSIRVDVRVFQSLYRGCIGERWEVKNYSLLLQQNLVLSERKLLKDHPNN